MKAISVFIAENKCLWRQIAWLDTMFVHTSWSQLFWRLFDIKRFEPKGYWTNRLEPSGKLRRVRKTRQLWYLSLFNNIILFGLLISGFIQSSMVIFYFVPFSIGVWINGNAQKPQQSHALTGDSSRVVSVCIFLVLNFKRFPRSRFDDDSFSHVAYSSFLGEGQSTFFLLSFRCGFCIFRVDFPSESVSMF